MAQTLLGTRIRDRREAAGMKQTDVARSAGISASYLNLIEHNRRKIAGKVLIEIARVLEVSVASLSEGADVALVQDLQTAAATGPEMVELERLEEMIGRFPGWSRLIAGLSRQNGRLEHDLKGLSDRLTYDPFLAASLHEVLSTVTAIRSISSILANSGDIAADQQAQFHDNLFDESRRLADISRALVSHFEQESPRGEVASTPLDEFENFLQANGYHFALLETDGAAAIDTMLAKAPDLVSDAARRIARRYLEKYCARAAVLPLSGFLAAAERSGFAPDQLAGQLGVGLPDVFHRLACLPVSAQAPVFGLVICDLSGAVTFRKALPGFSLPRYGAACPLWPLYQAMARPHVPLQTWLETPENKRFLAHAQCWAANPGMFDAPQVLQSAMLFRAGSDDDRDAGAAPLVVPIGLNCRICPRENCPARREPTIYAVSA